MTDYSAPTRGDYERAEEVAVALLPVMPRNFDLAPFREAMAQSYAAHRLTAIEECAKAIADLPTGRTEEVMEGYEDAYRAIERLRNLGRGA